MEKQELIKKLKKVLERRAGDDEALHSSTDDLLFEYIDDSEVFKLCHSFCRWYT